MKKNQKEIKGPRNVNTHAIIGKEKKKKNRKIRLQTVRRIDRVHRSHSTCEAKQNKIKQEESRITNQDNKIA